MRLRGVASHAKRLLTSALPLVSIAALVSAALSGCGSAPMRDSMRAERPNNAKAGTSFPRARGGGYYLDDGPGDSPPADLDNVPEPVPKVETLSRGAMRPYVVMGQTYTPMTELTAYKARGIASWYGRRYHGKQTSNGEIYDMYGISAAHPLLPLPSYVRVTNVATGKSLVVRVNDRGPFIDGRLIDLSYTAAYRLGVLSGGSALVEVEAILPDAYGGSTAFASAAPAAAAAQPKAQPVSVPASVSDPIAEIVSAPIQNEAPTPREPPAPTSLTTMSGLYLQLGAFGSRENAESYLARAKAQVEWLAQNLHLVVRDGLYRIQAGPYASTSDARQAAERIALTTGTKPLVVNR
jgi:rare lipoprotein A